MLLTITYNFIKKTKEDMPEQMNRSVKKGTAQQLFA